MGSEKEVEHRAGFAALIGRPNVGKSTLLNCMLGSKLAAVTPKAQTTRNRILGVKNRPGAQLVLIDTPGIHKARGPLNRFMVDQAMQAIASCDVVVFIADAPQLAPARLAAGPFEPGPGNRLILERLAQADKPILLALNKVDLLGEKTALLPIMDGYGKLHPFSAIVPISAKNGEGVDALEGEIAARLPLSPPLYPEEMLTDQAERLLAGEMVREQAFILLADELPYSLAVTVESFVERPVAGGDADAREIVIDAELYVERDSQKGIVVGEGGRMIREIGTRARHEIGRLLGCPVHLRLHVKVDPDWTRTQGALRRMGYQ